MGFEGDEMYDRHGRPRRVNLLSVADYFSNDILAFDRYAQPESNRVYPLYPHQRIILNEMMDRVFLWVQVMRGGAKSSSFARGFIDYALMNPGAKIVLTAPTFRQSLLVFDEIARLIDLNAKNANSSFSIKGELKGDIRRGTIEALVEFKNGSLIKAVPMGDGCLVPSTQVLYSDRFGTISGYFSPTFDFKATAMRSADVWSRSGWKTSDEAYANGISQTYRVTTKRGFVIEGTANHGLQNASGAWVRLDEIQIGEKLPLDCSKRWHASTIPASNDECYALGLLIGDGCLTNKYRIGFTTTDPELAEAVKVLVPHLNQDKSDPVHWIANGQLQYDALYRRFGLNGQVTRDKSFPTSLLSASSEQTAAFISGLFDSDGSVEKKSGRVSFTNTSETLVRQLQFVLLHYGIVSSVRVCVHAPGKWEAAYELMIFGINLKKFSSSIGFRLERKRKALEDILVNKQRWVEIGHHEDGLYIDEVISIDNGTSLTFDCHVPDGNEYIANGFVSHNSKIRGLRGGILFVDEGYQITEEMYESHLAPFAGVEFNGRPSKIIITTTSWYADCFAYRRMMQIASEVKAGNPKYGILDFTLEDLETPGTVAVFRDGKYALEQKAFPLSKDISRDARMHGDPLKYAMTYYNFWPSANIRWYDQKSIDDAVASYHDVNIEMKRPAGDGSSYFGVVDLAASDTGDSTCILVAKVSKGIARWVYGVKAKGWNGHRRAWEAHEVIRRFGMDFLIYDAHGALGVDFKSDMAQDSLLVKDEAGNVSVKKVPPTVHYDERNKRGAPILIPLRVNDDAIAAALTGDKNTPIEGEDGLNNILHSKMRDLLQNGNMIGPGLDATTYLSDDQAAKTSYSGSEIEALDVVRSSFMQLASISLDKGLDGDIKTTKNGKLVFKKKNAASVDDGAFCLIYGVVGLLRLSGNDTTLSPRPKPIVRTLSADQIDGISVDQESVCNSQRLNYR